MDGELWAARLAAAKREHSLHHSQSEFDRLSVDGFEVEEDVRPDFPCPYCYEEYDIASLCSHLEDEHSYEAKPALCPVCSIKVGRDMLPSMGIYLKFRGVEGYGEFAHLFKGYLINK
ncbi:hypothetical protein SUGI_0769770 [Cryptomeria japonica]|nr:hypothetical protein SUGI_0769770 [Cryptomeria japonica]